MRAAQARSQQADRIGPDPDKTDHDEREDA